MDKTHRRLQEIAGHLEAITEEMQENKIRVLQGTLLRFYSEEIKELVDEMKALLGLT